MTETKKVLVADDEEDLREAIKTALSYDGYTVETARDGVEAFEKAEAFRPQVILLDIMMPRQNGIETLRAIRATDWGKEVPVMIMTVLDDMTKVSDALDAGANEYLVKGDISLGTIVQKVASKFVE